ncbi:hypothetical protein ACLOJK_014982, partial [Asimina triloba]
YFNWNVHGQQQYSVLARFKVGSDFLSKQGTFDPNAAATFWAANEGTVQQFSSYYH